MPTQIVHFTRSYRPMRILYVLFAFASQRARKAHTPTDRQSHAVLQIGVAARAYGGRQDAIARHKQIAHITLYSTCMPSLFY